MAGTIPIQHDAAPITQLPAFKGGLLDVFAPFHVLLTNRSEIEAYAATHADAVALLESICAKLRDAFGPHAELSLEMYRDPEQDDEYLSLYVRQQKYQAGILHQIEDVCAPFMPKLETASGNVIITTDFRRPRN
jgi:hypothetical protein